MNVLYLGDKVAIEGRMSLRTDGTMHQVYGTVLELRPTTVLVELGGGYRPQGFPYDQLTRAEPTTTAHPAPDAAPPAAPDTPAA